MAALESEFQATFHVVNSSFRLEHLDGSHTNIKPWVQQNVVGVTGDTVGRLVHGTLAEDMHRVNGVDYQKSDFILVSQYSHNEPSLEEFTAGAALAMTVIDDGDHVYLLDASAESIDIDNTELNFPKSASNRTFHVTGVASYDVESDAAWLTVSKNGETVTATAAANTGAAREATITVTSGELSETVAVTQAAGNE